MKSVIYGVGIVCVSIFLLNCGDNSGSPGPAEIGGPTLSLGEARQIEVNQFFINADWQKDESAFFDVYLQDPFYGNYIVCAGRSDGLDVASQRGVYYAKLSIPMRDVKGVTTSHESPEIKIIIAANQEDACPAAPDENKIIATATVTFNNLLDTPIALDNDMGYIAFKGHLHDDIDVPDMPALSEGTLAVGELYFQDSTTTSSIPQYYLVLNFTDTQGIDLIRSEEMPDMQKPEVIYSWLSAIFDGIDDTMLDDAATVTLYRFGDNDPVEIGKIDATPIKKLIGNKFEFTNGRGYIKFRDIVSP